METKDSIQEAALEAILPHDRAGVNMSVGTGKTKLGLNYLNKYYTDYCKFLVVAPKKSIFKSWTDDIEKFNMSHLLPHITFSTYLSLDKQSTDFDIVICDEVHNLLFSHDFWMNNYGGKILGMTGTWPKHRNSEKGKMVDKYCPLKYTYKTDEAIDDNILNDYKVEVHTLSLDNTKNILIEKSDKAWYTSEQAIYNYWTGRIESATSSQGIKIARIQRMKAMMEFPSKERLAQKLMGQITDKCIVFCNTHKQAEKLCIRSYHSKNPESQANLEMFNNGDCTKLSCILQLSEGISVKDLKYGIVLHSYGNERKLVQRFGRLCRLLPTETATLCILCYINTIDETWCTAALSDLDQSKITWK